MMYYNNNSNYAPQKRQQQPQIQPQQSPIIPKIQGSTEMQNAQDNETLEEQYLERECFLIPRKYKLIELRGKGSYGVVAAARNTVTKKQIAIKKNIHVFPVYIPLNNSSNSNRMTDDVEMFDNSLGQAEGNAAMYVDSQTKKQYVISTEHPHRSKTSQLRILRELKILIHLGLHPNIICLRDVIPPRNFYSFSDVYFVNDLMEADLRDIVDSDQELSDEHVQYFMYQILIAMSYIHAANILHRDLKPENILLNSDCELKICDFGLARGMEEEDVTMSTAYVQTRWYRAPELLLNNPTVNKQVDIWSVGCIFAELMSRQVLFRGNNPLDQLKKIIYIMGTPAKDDIKSGTEEGRQFVLTQIPFSPGKDFKKLFPKANPMALDLMKKLLSFNPEKRYTAEQALRHPYFKSIFNEEDLEPSKVMKPFNYDFEQEAETKGLKEMCYETIMNFYKTKQGQTKTSPRIEVTPTKESNAMVDCSQTQKSKPAESPISDLMQSYFNNTTKIK